MAGQAGFFDIDGLVELSAKGDDLERLNKFVDFESFAVFHALSRLEPE
jgi:hypothetical protein